MNTLAILGFFVVAGIILLGLLLMITRFYRKVEQGKALIVNTLKSEPEVTFTGKVVLPIIHKAEVMDISVKTIEIDRRGKEGLICQDNIRADIKVAFFVRVNKTTDDVIKVAQSIGCVRASDPKTLEELFNAKFSEALKTVGKQLDFVDLYTKRDEFRDRIIEVIGRDLNGYVLEDAAIDYLEQTPMSSLDENNILDAQGIRKITELTAIEKVRTNEYLNQERKQIRRQDVEAQEAILELDRQQADAEAKQTREIETLKSREVAETLRVQAEERLKSETARIKTDEDVAVMEENQQRQVEVARKNRERIVAIEEERVHKARALEIIEREREVEVQRISKDKQLEEEKRLIAEVVRQRVIVDRTVAEEEEGIKRLRLVEEASRDKEAKIITAEGEAEQLLVRDIKSAEAAEKSSHFRAKERLLLADTELEAADREAKAKIRLAEGVQAESAAEGLATVRVREANAVATEKVGLAEVRVRLADADATTKTGQAEAEVLRSRGGAEAEAMQLKLSAEAKGLHEKADAMKALNDAGLGHEEFRLRIDMEKTLGLEAIVAQREVAEAQARVLGEALQNANIDIVGGDAVFLDRIVGAISMGKAVDSAVAKSTSGKALLGDYMSGDASAREDIKQALAGLGSSDVRNLSVAGFLARLAEGSSGPQQKKISELLEYAQSLGLGDGEKG